MNQRKLGALYGALIGDAVGVPYEFNPPDRLPSIELLEMVPPPGFRRTYQVPSGTWSDDGSLLLCLLEALQANSTEPAVWAERFTLNAIEWRHHGYFAVDGKLFDIGMQTADALTQLERGADPLARVDGDYSSGNGSLMRGLAPALVATNVEHAFELGKLQSKPTHATPACEATCAVYAAMAYQLLQGAEFEPALKRALGMANGRGADILKAAKHDEVTGSGYVINSFWSAIYAVRNGKAYKDTIQQAIALGNDTDTTACIAGGLAGAMYGVDGIPSDWMTGLRGKELLTNILKELEK